MHNLLLFFWLVCWPSFLAAGEPPAQHVLKDSLVHLRSAEPREWDDFPEQAEAKQLDFEFHSMSNRAEWTLLLRQQDVKQIWRVMLNDKPLGELLRDENHTEIALAVPSESLREGMNRLRIEARSATPDLSDDIRVGAIRLIATPVREVLEAATLDVQVLDDGTQRPTPCRITIVNSAGSLQVLGINSTDEVAVRPGVVYTSRGQAHIKLPAGEYTVYAGRGFEYSLAREKAILKPGESRRVGLSIRREVPTEGYVACDTHLHTLTHSGHGDATITERLITLAGEGIELPIATDHNKQIDYEPLARQLGVRQYFTPVVGNEVTTPRGHFNIFPVDPAGMPPDHQQQSWEATFEGIRKSGARVAILNHARDLHSNVRPFGPTLFNAATGDHAEKWPELLNAMETVNSGATQTDKLRLFFDWMALLNRGRQITPVGSSDSHDVARHFPGQGRTYIRVDDHAVEQIDVETALQNFVRGQVMVSYGLLAELIVNDRYRSGELAPRAGAAWNVSVRVLGPHWVEASTLFLLANGELIETRELPADRSPDLPNGVKWAGTFRVAVRSHDVHLVAIAMGPGVSGLYWPTAKPYQPASTDGSTRVIGCSGAVWLDNDGDGRATPARITAERIMSQRPATLEQLGKLLHGCDAAVAAQAAALWEQAGQPLTFETVRTSLTDAESAVVDGFRNYLEARRAIPTTPKTPPAKLSP